MKKIVFFLFLILISVSYARFVQVNENGFGDNQNSAIKKMIGYKNILYAGIQNGNGTQIWKTSDGHHWLESTNANAGFGDNQNNDIYSMVTFNGDLFVGTYNGSTGGEVWRTSNGGNWNQRNQDGFGDANNVGVTLYSNNGYLYAGIEHNWGEGSRMYRSSNPNPFFWTFVSQSSNGFGNSDNQKISSFCAFNGKLYAGVQNWNTGASVYESANGTNWNVLNETTNGFHTGNILVDIPSMIEFKGQLYAGCNDGSIYRTPNGTNWEKVRNSGGFGGTGIFSFSIYSNYLYVGTLDSGFWTGTLLRSSSGDSSSWKIVNNNGWGDGNNQENFSLAVFSNALFVGNQNWQGGAIYSDLKFDYLYLTNYNAPESFVSAGTTNVTVMSFSVEDFFSHPLSSLKIQNLGTMSNGVDLTNMKIWYDVNQNNKWDTNDIFVNGPAVYSNGIQKWCFNNVNVLANTNIIITIDIPLTARTNYKFKGFVYGHLHQGEVICSNGGTSINSISNINFINIGPHFYGITKNINLPAQNTGGSVYTTILSFYIQDTGNHKLTTLKIQNLGTMSNSDVNSINLYYDNDNSFTYSTGDVWAGSMNYDSGEKKWIFQSGNPWPAPIEPNTNLVVVLGSSQNGVVSNTFKPFINIGDVKWSCDAFNTTTISNDNEVTRIDEVVPRIISDIPETNIYAGSANNTVLYFQVTNFYPARTIKSISVRNLGTAEDGLDINQMRLWRDTDGDKIGNVLLANGTYNSSTHLWYFGNALTINSSWDLVISASLAISARSNRTIKAYIENRDIYNSAWVRNNQAITNQYNVIIKNTNDVVAIITNSLVTGPFYTVTSNFQNKEVLDFKYIDTKGHNLRILNIANLSNMQAGADVASVKVWQDKGTTGLYENGVDIYEGELVWNGVNKWTNSNLSIPEGSDVLVTIDTTPTINSARTFRAYIMNTNDIQCEFGVSPHNIITNSKTLYVDLIPPNGVVLKNDFASLDKVKLEWNAVTNSDLYYYEIVYDTVSHPIGSGYSFSTNVNTTSAILSGLMANQTYYYRVRAVDSAGNKSISTNEGSIKTAKLFSLTMHKMQGNGLGEGSSSQQISKQITFKSNLYISVMNWNGCKIYRSDRGKQFQQVNIDGFGKTGQADAPAMVVFSNYLYIGVDAQFGPPAGCEIWRTSNGTNWQKVVDGGVEDNNHNAVLSMAVFNGAIYAGTRYNFGGTAGCEIWKTTDGSNWNKALGTEGFGNANNLAAHAMAVFNNKIFVGVDNFGGAQVWWSDDGATWHQSTQASNGFGNSNNSEIHSMIAYQSQLYATTYNLSSGAEVWVTANGTNWKKIITDGFLDKQVQAFPSMIIYSNDLYVGGYYNWGNPFIWLKTSNGTNWEQFDNNGFGNNNNNALYSMGIFESNMFAGTYNTTSGCELWSDIPNKVDVVKISDVSYSLIAPNQKNITILNFQVNDLLDFSIDTIKLKNLGTMSPSEINALQLWYDVDKNEKYSSVDTKLGFPAGWNSIDGTWDFLFLSGLPNTNLIITMDVSSSVVIGHTFKGAIDFNSVELSGIKNDDTAITNQFFVDIASNYYVQTNGNNLNSGLFWGTNKAWQSIQYAVSIAPKDSTIYVGDGIYHESILIQDKKNLDIVSTNKAVVSGDSLRDVCFKVVHSSNIVVKNFEESSSLLANVGITNAMKIIIENNIVHSSLAGINVQSAREISIMNSHIYSNQGYGIRTLSTRNSLISNNIIENNALQDMALMLSMSNRILKNIIYGTNVGCMLYNANNNFFNANHFGSEKVGLYSILSTNNQIIQNSFVSNTNNGIVIFNSSKNDIAQNTLFYSQTGITFVSNSQLNDVYENTNAFNRVAGIALVDSPSSNRIFNNVFFSNDRGSITNGDILIKNTSQNIVSNNQHLGGKSFFAIAVISNALDNRIVANSISHGYYVGVGVVDTKNVIVEYNDISLVASGIFLDTVSDATLQFNNIYNNSTNGVTFLQSTNILFSYNSIMNNPFGLMFTNSAQFSGVYQNNINNNNIGLALYHSPISNIMKNNIDNITNCIITGFSIPLTNNWWSTTIANDIQSTILGNADFIPYRLFGAFEISPTADTTTPSQISSLSATIINKTNVYLSWNSVTGATRYFIYRTNVNSWSNFTRSKVVGITTSTNWTNTETDGTWYYFATALDNAPYTNEVWYSAPAFVIIDLIGPSVVSPIFPTNHFITNDSSVDFLWTSATDIGVGVTNYVFHITNSSTAWATNIITANTNLSVTVLSNGTNFWSVRAVDKYTNYGNWSTTNQCVVDLTSPLVSLISPLSNSVVGNVDVLFQWNSVDSLSGIAQERIDIDTDNNIGNGFEVQVTTNSPFSYIFLGNSTNHWRVWAQDGTGHTNYSSIWKVVVNTNLPIATLHTPILVYTNSNHPEFIWSDESINGSTSNIIQISTTNDFSAIVRTSAGNASFTNWTVNPALPTSQYYWRVRTYKLSTTTWYTSAVSWVFVDTNIPQSSLLSLPQDFAFFSNNMVSFVWTKSLDTGSGIDSYTIEVSSNYFSTILTNMTLMNTNIMITLPLNKIYQWRVFSIDKANNKALSTTNSFIIDSIAPSQVSLLNPVDNVFTNGNTIQFLWTASTDSLSGVTNYNLQLSTMSNFSLLTTNIILSQTNITLGLSDSTYFWRVVAIDKANNIGEWSATNNISVDTTGPSSPNLVLPANAVITNSSSIQFVWNSSTDAVSGVSNYQITVTNMTSNWTTNIMVVNTNSIVNLWDGTNLWKVRAQDKVGLTGQWSSTNQVVVDTMTPSLSLISPVSNSTNGLVTVVFQWNAIDSLSGIKFSEIKIDTDNNIGNGFEIQKTNTSPYTNIFSGNSTNHWYVFVTDNAGNTNISPVWSIIIDTNYHKILLSKTNIASYEVTHSALNCPILAFHYEDTQNDTLKSLALTNLGTMSNGRDIASISIYDDTSTSLGVFDATEPLLSRLYYDTSTHTWTNHNLSISNDIDLLIVFNATASIKKGTTFQAGLIGTNALMCSDGKHLSEFITNLGLVTADSTPPVFNGNYSIIEENAYTIKLIWSSATDTAVGPNPITYNIYVTKNPANFDYNSPNYTVVNSTEKVIDDLQTGTYYFVLLAVDSMGNVSTTTNTHGLATISRYEDNLDNVQIYPIPVKGEQNLKIDKLTKKATFKLYSVSGIEVFEKELVYSGGPVMIQLSDYNLAPGVYIAVISDDKQTIKKKIVYIK